MTIYWVFWLTVPYAVAEKRLIKVHFLFAKVRNQAPPRNVSSVERFVNLDKSFSQH